MKTTSRSLITLITATFPLIAIGQAPTTPAAPSAETTAATSTDVSPSAARANLESLFKALDTNADGTVSREEFLNGSAAFAQWTQSHGKKKAATGATDVLPTDSTNRADPNVTGTNDADRAAGKQTDTPGTKR